MSEIQLVTFLDSGDFASAKPFGFQEMVGAVGLEIILSSVLKDLRNILRNRKKQLSSLGNAYCCPKAASFFSSRLPPRQQHFHYLYRVLPASLVGPHACRCSWLSECQRGAAILAAPSSPHRTPGEESNTCDEMCANQCARSWPLFPPELGDVPAGVRASTVFQSPGWQRPNRCPLLR